MKDNDPLQEKDTQVPAELKDNESEESRNWKYKLTHIDDFRRNLIFSLWGGGVAGAVAGYTISVLKGAPIQMYMTSMTMTFGFGAMVFYGTHHYLQSGMGNTVWTWMISGAATGIVGGLIVNPRYLPFSTLCFTGLGALGYLSYLGWNRYYESKKLRLKKDHVGLTEEEEARLKELSVWRKPKWISKK